MKLPYGSHRHGRWAWRVLFATVGVYVLYLFAGNVFLNTPLGPWAVNRKPEKFEIHWASGSTWWPGQVSVSEVNFCPSALSSWARTLAFSIMPL